MSLAAYKVRSFSPTSNIPDCGNCSVRFDGSSHTRGHYSNQGFCAAIEIDTGLVLDYQLYERVCNKCIRWIEEKKASIQRIMRNSGLHINPSVLLTSKEVGNPRSLLAH